MSTLVLERQVTVKMKGSEPMAEPLWQVAEIAKATDVPAETIRTWFKRRIISLDDDKMGEAAEAIGFGRKFSGYMAMTIAIMGKLAGSMTAEQAKDIAYTFVVGADGPGRWPCHPFASGETLLVIAMDGPRAFTARVVNMLPGDPWLDPYKAFGPSSGATTRVQIMRLTELWQTVFQRLGIRGELEKRMEGHAPA